MYPNMRYRSEAEGSWAKHTRSKLSRPCTLVSASVERNCGTTIEKLRSEDGHGLLTAQLRDGADEVKATEPALAVVPNVVEEDEGTVGPAAEHWKIQVERIDDLVDVVRPQLRVVIAVARLVR